MDRDGLQQATRSATDIDNTSGPVPELLRLEKLEHFDMYRYEEESLHDRSIVARRPAVEAIYVGIGCLGHGILSPET